MKSDVHRIAKATGYSEKEIQEIKDFIFTNKHDLTLIKHEKMEKGLIKQGYTQAEAHNMTSKIHNYDKEANEFYGKIKKYKKE